MPSAGVVGAGAAAGVPGGRQGWVQAERTGLLQTRLDWSDVPHSLGVSRGKNGRGSLAVAEAAAGCCAVAPVMGSMDRWHPVPKSGGSLHIHDLTFCPGMATEGDCTKLEVCENNRN